MRLLILAACLLPIAGLAESQLDPVRVQLSAVKQTMLSSGIAGRVNELNVKEGDRFKQGQTLLTFDCTVLQQKLNYSNAAEQAARKKVSVANRLDKLNAISVSDVDEARAALSMAQAEGGVNRAMLKRCNIIAPFNGRVTEARVRQWETVPEGKELLAIYDDSAFELESIVPSRWLVWLKMGTPFTVTLDETGQTYQAEISRISSSIEPVSQSVKVFGKITHASEGLLPGMSGEARFVPAESSGNE